MLGDRYLDMALLEKKAVGHLKEMKAVYGLSTFVDCTPVNIGRDISLLKRVSAASGVNIIASTGFYYTDEEMLRGLSSENILRRIIEDVEVNPIGLIKFAAEWEELSPLNEKLLDILCEAQKTLALPFCIHTNAQNRNALKVLEFVLKRGICPEALTIAHCSDTRDLAFLEEILRTGCYIGFDRIYPVENDDYPAEKAADLYALAEKGWSDRILLSHDCQTFNGFIDEAHIRTTQPYSYLFRRLVPAMEKPDSPGRISAGC